MGETGYHFIPPRSDNGSDAMTFEQGDPLNAPPFRLGPSSSVVIAVYPRAIAVLTAAGPGLVVTPPVVPRWEGE